MLRRGILEFATNESKLPDDVEGKVSKMSQKEWTVGEWVIYRKQKNSESPGPRAEAIHPHVAGEEYTYLVDKYWIIEAIAPSGELKLITRTGKRHLVSQSDPRLRKLRWWERWSLANRFRAVELTLESSTS